MPIEISIYDPQTTYQGQKQFDCEHPVIHKFVAGSLKQQVSKGLTVAHVLTDPAMNHQFVGFYTSTMASISSDLLGAVVPGSLPRSVGCVRLVMLGVDKNYKKQDLGLRMLRHALASMKAVSKVVGCLGLYLDADPLALGFYQKYGFVNLEPVVAGHSTPMFIHVQSVV
jgi:GNAT superfamily N-acetyltransferase